MLLDPISIVKGPSVNKQLELSRVYFLPKSLVPNPCYLPIEPGLVLTVMFKLKKPSANLVMDHITSNPDPALSKDIPALLKNSQRYRECPFKDRSKRFIVNNLPFGIPDIEHDVKKSQYWTIYPTDKVICSAKLFLLSSISQSLERQRTALL